MCKKGKEDKIPLKTDDKAVVDAVTAGLRDALQSKDEAKILAIPDKYLTSGTSEVKNWVTLAGFLSDTPLEMTVSEYIPCYRSVAGTGNAMAFGIWQ